MQCGCSDVCGDAAVRTLAAVRAPLDAAKYPHAVPFALTIVAKHLKTPWQLIRLATKMAPGRHASRIASTRYAASVSMVLDHLDDKRLALRRALKSNRVAIAKDILTEIYAIEDALQVRIEDLGASEWRRRLDGLMAAVAADLQIEFQGLPEGAHHVLGSCKRHPHESAQGMLTSLRGMLGLGRRPSGWPSGVDAGPPQGKHINAGDEGAVLIQPEPMKP